MATSKAKAQQQQQNLPSKTSGFLSSAFKTVQKLGDGGVKVLQQVAPNTASKLGLQTQHVVSVREAQAKFQLPEIENPQQLLRAHLPKVSQQLLGKHYSRVSGFTHMISPTLGQNVADYAFAQLNMLADQLSEVQDLLEMAKVEILSDLAADPTKAKQLSQQLREKNKMLALAQGAVSGATGMLGVAVDVPTLMTLALKTIYQTGRSYGFELSGVSEQSVVHYIFKQLDLSLMAEKQILIQAVKGFKQVLAQNEFSQIQQLLGSSNDPSPLKKWLSDEQGQMNWKWLHYLPSAQVLSKLSPVATSGLSALYSWKVVDDAGIKAELVFAQARQYLQLHPHEKLLPLDAYLKSMQTPSAPTAFVTQQPVYMNPDIQSIHVSLKSQDALATSETSTHTAEQIHEQGMAALTQKFVQPHDDVLAQQPAISAKTADLEHDMSAYESGVSEDDQSALESNTVNGAGQGAGQAAGEGDAQQKP